MSHVADVVLWTRLEEEDRIAPVQAWLEANHYGQLVEISEHAGGTKRVQALWWAGAFNYLDIPSFLRLVFAQPWECPECVAVTIKDEHEDRPTLYTEPPAP